MKSAMGFAKGAMIGMAAGAALTMVGRMMMKNNDHHLQKGSSKAMKAVGDFVDGVQTMMR